MMSLGRISLVFVAVVCYMFGGAHFCHAGSLKAFSIREANRFVKEGKADAPGLTDLGGITRIVGMVFDRDTGDVILIGKVRADMPPASLDDLVVALRSRLGKGQYPTVSIDMVEDTAKTGMQKVRFEGGIEETQFGGDFLDSDVVLKLYSLDLLQRVNGVEPYLKLYEADVKKEMAQQNQTVDQVKWLSEEESARAIESYVGKQASDNKTVQSRFWYYVDDKQSFIVEQDDVYVIEELRLGVKAETMQYRDSNDRSEKAEEKRDLVGEEFARQFSEQFWQVSEENPALRRLKVLFDLVCVAEGIARLDKERPNLDHLLRDYRVAALDTPEQYRLVQRVGEFRGQNNVAQLVQLSGGIDMEAILLALEDGDVSALKMAVLLSRPDARALCWNLPLDQWKMPNDLPPQAPSADAKAGGVTTIQPKELGFTMTLQRFTFDPRRSDGTGQVFRGFPTPPPVAPLQSTEPDLKRLPQLTPSKPPRLSGPAPLPAPALGKADQVRWNLIAAATPGHSGKILILPTGQLHEGPGSAGVPSASYHWHPLDSRTGIHVATAIPLDRSLKPIGVVPQTVLDSLSAEFVPGSLREPLQDALASGNWRQVVKAVSSRPESLLYPVPRLAYAHAMIELNRMNEAAALFASVRQKLALLAWAEFAGEFVEKHPDNAIAHYLMGDSHARFKEWDRAEVEFTSALGFDPELHLAQSARAVVHIAQGKHDPALVALTDLTVKAPTFADGLINLGNYHIRHRTPEGADAAFQRALALDGSSAIALIGSAIAGYGAGQWGPATRLLEQAAEYPIAEVWDAARQNHMSLLEAQGDFYVSSDPSDLLPARSPHGGGTTQSFNPNRPTDTVAGDAGRPHGRTRERGISYRPQMSANRDWTAADRSYRQQIDVMRQQVEMNQRLWEAQVRRQQADIGGITMNMQRALADRGDWPMGTFFTLGYFEIPPAGPRTVGESRQ
ncbi:MAG: tetratricopeptide repeat protein [Planctomycetes bacterium]|nr:tetratricopeptide repeat protein [Planctomycetota bacterium]